MEFKSVWAMRDRRKDLAMLGKHEKLNKSVWEDEPFWERFKLSSILPGRPMA
jgi:hypothetical protein